MWIIKKFPSALAQAEWIKENEYRYQITVLFVNNGYAVEYRRLTRVY